MINFSKIFVSLFFVGYFPIASGTVGTFVSLILIFLFLNYFSIFTITIFFILLSITSVIFINIYSDTIKKYDASEIVIDEFLGQSIPIYLYEISHGTTKESNEAVIYYTLFFILFRYFDIMKPFPVIFFDKNFKNSFGVIMDDICAGLYVVLTVVCLMIVKSYVL